MAHILIAGCGYIGTRLAEILLEQGHQVSAINRSAHALPPGVSWVQADLSEPLADQLINTPIDYVFYTASATGLREEAVYQAIYADGPENVLRWLEKNHPGVQRFIFTSSTGVYGQQDASWVNEDSPTEPSGFSGQKNLLGEAATRAAFCGGVVVRFSGIYGPDRMRWTHSAPTPGRYTNHIHREDCARVLLHVMMLEEPASCYLATDCEPYVRTGTGELKSRRNSGNKRCSNRRLLESGYAFVYPTYREGIAHENA
jgi:nucleoside-diphosphate-sugar epimerase